MAWLTLWLVCLVCKYNSAVEILVLVTGHLGWLHAPAFSATGAMIIMRVTVITAFFHCYFHTGQSDVGILCMIKYLPAV